MKKLIISILLLITFLAYSDNMTLLKKGQTYTATEDVYIITKPTITFIFKQIADLSTDKAALTETLKVTQDRLTYLENYQGKFEGLHLQEISLYKQKFEVETNLNAVYKKDNDTKMLQMKIMGGAVNVLIGLSLTMTAVAIVEGVLLYYNYKK